MPFAGFLALTNVGIDRNNPFAGPGHILGVDIFFNTDVGLGIIPEPCTLLLLASGLIGLIAYGRKKFF